MAKIVSIPSHIISSSDDTYYFNLVNNAPTKVGTVTRNGNNMEVVNISLNQLKTLLGGTTFSLSDICRLASVNQYSYYKPNGVSPYRMGDFAGYNHLAKPSTYFAERVSTVSVLVDSSGGIYTINLSPLLSVILRRGELPPSYAGGGEISWDDIDIHFELRANGAGDGGTIIDENIVEGVSVPTMQSSGSGDQYPGSFIVSNGDAIYKLNIRPYYMYNGPQAIEDSPVIVTITAAGFYVVDIAWYPTLITEPAVSAISYSLLVWNNIPNNGNSETYAGKFRCVYTYNTDEFTEQTRTGETSGDITLSPGGTQGTGVTASMIFDYPVGAVDTAWPRTMTVYYENDTHTGWIELIARMYS